jgi:hypothetical protein
MTDETGYPRLSRLATLSWYRYSHIAPDELLRRVDAADPLRAMLGEVVEALEKSWSPYKDDTPPDVRWHERRDRILARLRAATEGGTDDER